MSTSSPLTRYHNAAETTVPPLIATLLVTLNLESSVAEEKTTTLIFYMPLTEGSPRYTMSSELSVSEIILLHTRVC
jgi:hypothetical protein